LAAALNQSSERAAVALELQKSKQKLRKLSALVKQQNVQIRNSYRDNEILANALHERQPEELMQYALNKTAEGTGAEADDADADPPSGDDDAEAKQELMIKLAAVHRGNAARADMHQVCIIIVDTHQAALKVCPVTAETVSGQGPGHDER
jgi:ribosomal protein L12E/L44/L45/RPP1/RPP2